MAEDKSFVVGVDLGQSQDWTCFAVLEKTLPEGAEDYRYAVRHLERPRLGTLYPVIVDRIKDLLALPLLKDAQLVVDQTGVGAAVIDLMRLANLPLTAVTITAGDQVYRDPGAVRVPKRDLVASVSVLLQTGRLTIARELALAPVLVRELENFRMKLDPLSGHDSYSAWRESDHDDMVLSVAMACWHGENGGPSYLPFAETGEAREAWGGVDDFFQTQRERNWDIHRGPSPWGFG